MMKFLHGCLITFLLCINFTQAQEAKLNKGIAFIHGTSNHTEDAYGGYWKADFIDSMAQALDNPDNHFVVHCDFSQYMWHQDAAQCMVEQLLGFIESKKITHLTVFTHSNGANVLRFILSNPTFDSSYLKLSRQINQVIAIAPSSNGTPLADEVLNGGVFQTSVGWLLGYLSDAIKQQRVGDMTLFNEELLFGSTGRPSLKLPFKIIVGSDVTASPFNGASYCNGYVLNTGLKLTQLYLENCSDGFLNCKSQTYAGKVWFIDTERTEDNRTLSHNQSRHSCFGLDTLLMSALVEGDLQ